jgi:hypothetical protein
MPGRAPAPPARGGPPSWIRDGSCCSAAFGCVLGPAVYRAFWKINASACPPGQAYTDPDVVAATQKALRQHGAAPPVTQPTLEQLAAALTS